MTLWSFDFRKFIPRSWRRSGWRVDWCVCVCVCVCVRERERERERESIQNLYLEVGDAVADALIDPPPETGRVGAAEPT
jgi:hypothetical protein